MTSRVVPGISVTIAASRSASAFKRLDLPAFGAPTMATLKPERRISPLQRADAKLLHQQNLAARRAGQMGFHVSDQPIDGGAHPRIGILPHIALVGEVEGGFDHSPRARQPLHPAFIDRSQGTARLGDGRAALGLRLGRQEIGQTLRLGQVDAAVLEGPAGEFPRLCRANALDPRRGGEEGSDDRPSPMKMEFRHILAGHGLRRVEEEGDASINDSAVAVPEGPQARAARLGHATRQTFEQAARL